MIRNFSVSAICAAIAFPAPVVLAEDHAHWGYAGGAGPTHWADLDQDFKTCKLGKLQSPINIDTGKVEKAHLKPMIFAYKPEQAKVVNNGHTIQVDLPAGSTVTIQGTEYKLLQFHFHAPSEEKIDGKVYPLVAHLVHRDASGKLAVIAVLYKEGRENNGLKSVFDNLPVQEGESRALPMPINAADLLPADRSYFAYTGSLTTPPCSEDVRWQVLKTPAELSEAQLSAFRKLYKMNARPVQPLNDRAVQASD